MESLRLNCFDQGSWKLTIGDISQPTLSNSSTCTRLDGRWYWKFIQVKVSFNNLVEPYPISAVANLERKLLRETNQAFVGCLWKVVFSRLSSDAIAGIVIRLMTQHLVLASLSIGYFQNKQRKSISESKGNGGCGNDGKLIQFQGGEHLTLKEVLTATEQIIEKTSYGTVYKVKLADGGVIALRLLREDSWKDRIRHENLIHLIAC